MKQVTSQDDITGLGTILGIWAHPDDETYTMAGILAAAAANGQKVVLVTATRGELGVQDESRWPQASLGEIREKELAKALKILGVDEHHWLDYPDGGCEGVDQIEAVERIAICINAINPDSIFTFGPDGMTGHDDHKTVSKWVDLAMQKTKNGARVFHSVQTPQTYQAWQEADKELNVFFNIDKPIILPDSECDILFDMTVQIYDQKLAALKAMPSQTETIIKRFGDSLKPSIGTETFVLAYKH